MKYWTASSIRRIQNEIDALERSIGQYPRRRQDIQYGEGMLSETSLEAGNALSQQEGMDVTRLGKLIKQRSQLQEAPVPTDTDICRLGAKVTVRYLEDCTRKKCGDTEPFILGGDGESFSEEGHCQIVSCTSPLGRAMLSRKVGDIATYKLPNNTIHDVEIVAIEIPSAENSAGRAAHAA